MELVEIRDLDGPNVFLLQPAIKLELDATARDVERDALAAFATRLEPLHVTDEARPGGYVALGDLLIEAALALHRETGAPPVDIMAAELETPGHVALVFGWSRRRFARELARTVADLALGQAVDLAVRVAALKDLLAPPAEADDTPRMVRDAERTVPIVAITGTNGKTTTTRLVAHILQHTGRHVGWCSSSGVYIDGREVMAGDYTGPQGAWRVLAEPGLDVAVLETARGGILLRGLGYESNDVGVFTNISADHLDLQGIRTVEGLARVKATVVRVTRPEGVAVLNADDPLVRGVAGTLRAPVCYVSRRPDSETVRNHVAIGGRALFVRGDDIVHANGGRESVLARVSEIPITFGGRAGHMVENALCAAAACLGLGLPPAAVREGLASFHNSPEQNAGRLNVYDVDGVTVIVDFGHNEAGLRYLLSLAPSFRREGGRVISIVGTAGDRTDDALRALGRVAAVESDEVLIKETSHYLRGRTNEEMDRLYVEGIREGGKERWRVAPGELAAVQTALASAHPGDVIAAMCVEQQPEIHRLLTDVGRMVS